MRLDFSLNNNDRYSNHVSTPSNIVEEVLITSAAKKKEKSIISDLKSNILKNIVNIAESVKKLVKDKKLSPKPKSEKENYSSKTAQKKSRTCSLITRNKIEKIDERSEKGPSTRLLELQKELIIDESNLLYSKKTESNKITIDLRQEKESKYKEHDSFFKNKNDSKSIGNNVSSLKNKFIKLNHSKAPTKETDSSSSSNYLNIQELLKYNYKGAAPGHFQKNMNKTFF